MATAFNRKIVLENGREFYGYGFGANVQAINEAVFNTSMAGYQEILSDLSYTGQMVIMTYPLVGGYGVNDEDYETRIPAMGGLVVREYSDEPSNFRYTKTLSEAMEEYGIPGISGIDTRTLTRIIRREGSCKMMITTPDKPVDEAVAEMKAYTFPKNVVERVSCRKRWYSRTSRHRYNVVAVDCGINLSMVRSLNSRGCNVTVVPYNTTADEIIKLCPDGVFLSNGPGDPSDALPVIKLVQELRGKLPIFGVCLGCQLIALAYGAKTYKMKLGHCGANHPVKNLATGKIEITGQNHSFVVDAASLAGTGLQQTHTNLLDNSVEGIACEGDKVFAVQYHPESAAGHRDSAYLYDTFVTMMEGEKNA